eukprot:4648794-Pleurochrysis_carterae.AAC.1
MLRSFARRLGPVAAVGKSIFLEGFSVRELRPPLVARLRHAASLRVANRLGSNQAPTNVPRADGISAYDDRSRPDYTRGTCSLRPVFHITLTLA